MKKRVAKKRDKQLTSFALACERIASNVVEKVSNALHLQSDLDEYERFLGDLLIMLVKKEPQCVVEHSVPGDDKMGWIWDEVCKLVKENKELAQNLKEKGKNSHKAMNNDLKCNFKKEFKLWKACAKDLLRPVMEHVLLKGGYAYASDAHVLVRVPLAECTTFDEDQRALLDGYLIHSSMLKYIVGFNVVSVNKTDDGDVYLEAHAGENTISLKLAKNGDILKFPNVEAILQGGNTRTLIQRIGLGNKNIASLAEALGTDRLKFEFSDEKSPVFARPLKVESNAVGAIMPFLIDC